MSETTNELPGVNVMVMGPAGTGKTHSIGTLVDSGLQVFYLALEPGLESLLGYYKDRKQEVPANLHWHTLDAPKASFAEMIDTATKINTMSFEFLTKMSDPNRNKHNQFITLLTALNDFPDDRTGQKFGAVDSWGTDKCLVIDGLTGIGRCAMSLVVGGKPVKNQADWGVAQDQVERILRMLCENCLCHFVVIAHVERETDQILGGVKLTASTLGQKLAPKLPPMFSDIVLAVRNGNKWNWDTANPMADLKTRNLAISSTLDPSFAPIIAKWKARQTA